MLITTAQELIDNLQLLVDRHGDKNINIYKSYHKKTIPFDFPCYDESIDDIYLGIYD